MHPSNVHLCLQNLCTNVVNSLENCLATSKYSVSVSQSFEDNLFGSRIIDFPTSTGDKYD